MLDTYFFGLLVAVVACQPLHRLLLKCVLDQLLKLSFFDTDLIIEKSLFPGPHFPTGPTEYLIGDFSLEDVG